MHVTRQARAVVLAIALASGTLPLLGASPAGAATWDGTVDWNDVRQTIDGFGGSTAFGMADKVMSFPTTKRNEILDRLFSTTTGAGLSIIRLQVPNIKPTEAGAYNYTPDNGQASFVDAARLRNPARLMATVWSPPGWMKSNGSENGGGTVLAAKWAAFADYLRAYAQRYQSRGTPLYAISPANEPDAATSYPSSQWSGDDLRDFTKNNVAPVFVANGITARYLIPENSYWNEDRALPSLADPASAARVDIVAGHGYAQATNPQPFVTAAGAGKPVWQTEMSTLGAPEDLTIADGIVEAQRVHAFLTQANANAFLHWWLATDKANTREALINLQISLLSKNYTVTKRLWALGNWARFVRPGWIRIGATAGDMPVTAFKDPATGKFAVVVVNAKTSSQVLNLRLNGMAASSVTPYTTSATQNLASGTTISTSGGFLNATVAPNTIVSFVGTATTTSPLAATVSDSWAWTGEVASATVTVINGGTTSNSGTVTIAAPTGVTPTPASAPFGPLAPGARTEIPVSLAVSSSATTGTPSVLATATLTGGTGTVVGSNLIRIYGSNHTFVPNTGAERPWLFDAGASQLNGAVEDGNARFTDGTSTATYRIQLPADVTGGTIDLDIGNSFTVDTSTDGVAWTNRLVQTPAVTNLSNRAYRSLDVNTVRAGGTVVYIRVGDSFPADGWGGWLAHVRFALTRL